MSTLVRLLHDTIHNLTGSVRRGDVVEVPDDLATHWTGQGLAEEAKGAKPTRGVPQVEDEQGTWHPADDPAAPDTTVGVAEPTSGPLTGRDEATVTPEPAPAPAPEPAPPPA
jgi:hypothetical protein